MACFPPFRTSSGIHPPQYRSVRVEDMTKAHRKKLAEEAAKEAAAKAEEAAKEAAQ